MKHVTLLLLLCVSVVLGQNSFQVYFNEIRYDDAGSDDMEFVELIGPAGTDLSGMKIVHYNGSESSDGGLFTYTIENFILPDDGVTDGTGAALGFFVLALSADGQTTLVENADALHTSSMQNGPDALVLYQPCDSLTAADVLDAIAWGDVNSTDLLTNDPGYLRADLPPSANLYVHGIAENNGTDESIQNSSLVMDNDGSGWHIGAATPGALNLGQDNGLVELPVELVDFGANSTKQGIELAWQTATENCNLGFELYRSNPQNSVYKKIASYHTQPNLNGHGTTTNIQNYFFMDKDVLADATYWYKLADVNFNGERTFHQPISVKFSGDAESTALLPASCRLYQNYPNPFNPVTHFQVDMRETAIAKLAVYDALGKCVRTIHQGVLQAGTHHFSWDGRDAENIRQSSGVYFIALQAPRLQQTIKVILAQ